MIARSDRVALQIGYSPAELTTRTIAAQEFGFYGSVCCHHQHFDVKKWSEVAENRDCGPILVMGPIDFDQ